MNKDIFFAIPIMICIVLAMIFLIKWFIAFSEIKGISLFIMIKEGMKGLSYIKKDNTDFTEDEAKKLNRYHNMTYLFMLSGIGLIIIFMIVGNL